MRVPDEVLKSVVFIGAKAGDEPPYRGTGFIVSFDGAYGYPSWLFLVTAKHIAIRLEGSTFIARINRREGGPIVMQGDGSKWWYHPTEEVDIAVTTFAPPKEIMSSLDCASLPVAMFATESVLKEKHIGIGDQVFIAGLFTNVQKTTRNIPIVRTGNVAMIPGEPIPFADTLIHAYLVETRSIGGLSGSPVFVRGTVNLKGFVDQDGKPISGTVLSGNYYLLGAMIGHWDIGSREPTIYKEKVNMGIAAIVPAQKILDVLNHPDLIELRKKWDDDVIARRSESGIIP